ncbi:MAG: hypothetical protein IPN58_17395 [Anaerolineales bacterium]|nr:hypothetical protein [Anaerolineales bacterium]
MPEPAATGDDVQWGNPLTRTRAINALNDPAGPLAFLDAMARDLLKNFFHHRNTRTGEITPGCARLAFELPFKERAIFYTLGRLDTGPSCQRGGEIVQPPIEPAMAPDPDFEAFAAVFAAERSAKYGNQRGGMARPEKRAAIGAMVLDLTAEACAWALGRGARARPWGGAR